MLKIVLLFCFSTNVLGLDNQKILERDIESLTLYRNRYTTFRRTVALPHIKCIGGPCHLYEPSVIQCTNKGFDGSKSNWECKAELPNYVRFETTDVLCEGFEYSDDPYVLVGSCGVEYTIVKTGYIPNHYHDNSYYNSNNYLSSFYRVLFIVVLAGLFTFSFINFDMRGTFNWLLLCGCLSCFCNRRRGYYDRYHDYGPSFLGWGGHRNYSGGRRDNSSNTSTSTGFGQSRRR